MTWCLSGNIAFLAFRSGLIVKVNMQGLNGRPLTVKEYNELLKIIEKKGQPINNYLSYICKKNKL